MGVRLPSQPENRLKDSVSPYLRSAAHQPIDWYEWGDAAFARAKSENKPMLLDIGAVWCHWCHVIDRESYESAEIAKIINEHFIAVKVDRDERPESTRATSPLSARFRARVAGRSPAFCFLTASRFMAGPISRLTIRAEGPGSGGCCSLSRILIETSVRIWSARRIRWRMPWRRRKRSPAREQNLILE